MAQNNLKIKQMLAIHDKAKAIVLGSQRASPIRTVEQAIVAQQYIHLAERRIKQLAQNNPYPFTISFDLLLLKLKQQWFMPFNKIGE